MMTLQEFYETLMRLEAEVEALRDRGVAAQILNRGETGTLAEALQRLGYLKDCVGFRVEDSKQVDEGRTP